MHLKSLSLINFKNYDQLDLKFGPGINCFVGDNGTGKTNLLDAIYYLSLTKSYFNPIDTQNIMHGNDHFLIQGEYERDGASEKIHCGIQKKGKKKFKRNGKEYSRLSEHVGLIPVVMISPADSNLILEGSGERRKFINGVISQYNKQYLEDLLRYNRALLQRNQLLKNIAKTGKLDKEVLNIYSMQMIRHGKSIHQQRVEFSNRLKPVFQKYYQEVSGGREKVNLRYRSQLNGGDFKKMMDEAYSKDSILEYTTVGIHKDDLDLELGKHPIKKVGSQGQQKTYLVSLKLAKFEFIREVSGLHPILLLDDIFDKFDASRVEHIIKLVSEEHFGQIFITDTHTERIQDILDRISNDYKLFLLKEGTVEIPQ